MRTQREGVVSPDEQMIAQAQSDTRRTHIVIASASEAIQIAY
jgi:hypothetical protein